MIFACQSYIVCDNSVWCVTVNRCITASMHSQYCEVWSSVAFAVKVEAHHPRTGGSKYETGKTRRRELQIHCRWIPSTTANKILFFKNGGKIQARKSWHCRQVGWSSCCRVRSVFLHPYAHSWRVTADPPDHSSNHGGKTCHCRCVNFVHGKYAQRWTFTLFLYSNILVMKHRCQNLAVDPTASNV